MCKETKPGTDYYKNSKTRDKLSGYCKKCSDECAAHYRKSDKYKQRQKEYYEKNKEHLQAYQRVYQKAYYQKNKQRIKEQAMKRYWEGYKAGE